jgi:uncharacterized membrane protein
MAAVLLLPLSSSARQAVSEFGQSEPGSLLFGVLHLAIAVLAAAGALGLLRRAAWSARAIELAGLSAAALLAVQPLFEPMDSRTQRTIFIGAALVAIAGFAMAWLARRLTPRVMPRARAEGVESTANG